MRLMDKTLIGMLHAPALPGSPDFEGDAVDVRQRVLDDAQTLVDGGFRHLMLENFGDSPFHPAAVPQYVVAYMTALAVAVKSEFNVPLGINVLRNDGCAAMAAAHAAAADFIRVNVLCGARVTDQGIVQGVAHDLLRLRRTLGADVGILADVDVKHSAPLAARPVEEEVADLIHRGGADALIVSGAATGQLADIEHLRRVKEATGETPVFVGSGVTRDNIGDYLQFADGVIVGTALKREGVVANPVDPQRASDIVQALETAANS
jgi:hypothetical protein